MKSLSILFICMILYGCIGIGAYTSYYTGETVIKQDDLKENILKKHGKPDKIKKISELEEILIYNGSIHWSGVMLYVAVLLPVPIPIYFPTGFDTTEYYILNDVVYTVKYEIEKHNDCFFGYGLINEGTSATKIYHGCKGYGYIFHHKTPVKPGFFNTHVLFKSNKY